MRKCNDFHSKAREWGEEVGAFNFRAIMFTLGVWSSLVQKGGGRREEKKMRGRKEWRRPVGGMPKSNLEEPPDRFQWSLHCLPAFDIWSLLGTEAEVRPENQTKNICSKEGEIPLLVLSNESIYFPLPCFLISYQKEYCFSAHRGSSTFWQLVIQLHPERVPMSHKANSAISKQRPSVRERMKNSETLRTYSRRLRGKTDPRESNGT